MRNYFSILFKLTIYFFLSISICCNNEKFDSYYYITPDYSRIKLETTTDTIAFNIDPDSSKYNSLKAFTYFMQEGIEYLAFYNSKLHNVYIYDFLTKKLIKKVMIDRLLNKRTYKTSIYIKNFDSIFINNHFTLYLVDTSYVIKDSIDYLKENYPALSAFGNGAPLIVSNDYLYTQSRPREVQITNPKDLKRWKAMYEINLKSKNSKVLCDLPRSYKKGFFSLYCFYSSYCYNDRHFIFSYPADTNIYVTNFRDYYVAYSGKSKFHNHTMKPSNLEETKSDGWNEKAFFYSDSYASIYYDPYNRRYLRIAEVGLSEDEFKGKKWSKSKSIIIFDDGFKIIGESKISPDINLSTVLFTKDGNIYCRLNSDLKNQLRFIRLTYGQPQGSSGLVKNNR